MYRGWTQTDYQNKHYNINQKWLQYIQRMDTNRLPKQALQYKPKVATTCAENGHKQTTKTSTKIQTKRTKEHRTTEEEMEGPTSS